MEYYSILCLTKFYQILKSTKIHTPYSENKLELRVQLERNFAS